MLGGGTFWAAFADRPEVQAFQYYLTTPAWSNAYARRARSISANSALDPSVIKSPDRQAVVRDSAGPGHRVPFDASDLMPAEVGSDAEWKQFTAWITGQDDATTLANIDAAWPAELTVIVTAVSGRWARRD